MRAVTIYTTDEEYLHFLQLAKNLSYVKRIETDENNLNEEIITNIKAGLLEVKLFKNGKLKTTSAESFLNEL